MSEVRVPVAVPLAFIAAALCAVCLLLWLNWKRSLLESDRRLQALERETPAEN